MSDVIFSIAIFHSLSALTLICASAISALYIRRRNTSANSVAPSPGPLQDALIPAVLPAAI